MCGTWLYQFLIFATLLTLSNYKGESIQESYNFEKQMSKQLSLLEFCLSYTGSLELCFS